MNYIEIDVSKTKHKDLTEVFFGLTISKVDESNGYEVTVIQYSFSTDS